jgi:hypothetical protein
MSDFTVSEFYDAGRVEIASARDPLSLQASPARRARLKADLAAAVAEGTAGVFTGDVEVTIEWYVSEKVRYGTHMVADLDNIVKPLLDAVTGPDGVMIDDNQVQSLRVSWLDPVGPNRKFLLNFQANSPDEYLHRGGLFFVEFSPERCFPIFAGTRSDIAGRMVQRVDEMLREHKHLMDTGIVSDVARALLPIQRFFPKSRLGRFTVRPSTDFLLCRGPSPSSEPSRLPRLWLR